MTIIDCPRCGVCAPDPGWHTRPFGVVPMAGTLTCAEEAERLKADLCEEVPHGN